MSVPVAHLLCPVNSEFTSQLFLTHQESQGGKTHYKGLFSTCLAQNLKERDIFETPPSNVHERSKLV